MHLSRLSSPRVFHFFVADTLAAFWFLDGWSCKRTTSCNSSSEISSVPTVARYEVWSLYTDKRCRFFATLDTGFMRSICTTTVTFALKMCWCLPYPHNYDCVTVNVCAPRDWKESLSISPFCFDFVDKIIPLWGDNCQALPLSELFVQNCTLRSWREIFV